MMKRPARIKIVWVTIALLLGGSLVLSASAQMAGAMGNPAAANIIKIRKMTPVKERTPLYKTSVAGQAAGRAPEWWRVVVEFETSPDWIDELEFTYYAYLEDQSNKGLPVMYRGTVTYMNVAKGRHMSDMFLHPSTVVRRGLVKQIAVVVKVKGEIIPATRLLAPSKLLQPARPANASATRVRLGLRHGMSDMNGYARYDRKIVAVERRRPLAHTRRRDAHDQY